MKQRISVVVFVLSVFSLASFSQKNDIDEANATIKEFKETDPGMDKFFTSATGYAVFPGIGKGGLMYEASVGGQKFKVTPY